MDIAECFDLAEEFIAEEKSRQDYDHHLDREKNEAPNDDGVPFEPRIHRPWPAALRRGVLRRGGARQGLPRQERGRSTLEAPSRTCAWQRRSASGAALRGRADRLLRSSSSTRASTLAAASRGDLNDIVVLGGVVSALVAWLAVEPENFRALYPSEWKGGCPRT